MTGSEKDKGAPGARLLFRALGLSLLLLIGGAAVAYGGWQLSKSRSYQLLGDLVTRVETSDRVVALTFDDGPSRVFTDSILATLADAEARATFFFVGSQMERHPDVVERVRSAGHELGNHSYSHRRLVLRAPAMIREELDRTDELIRAAGQAGPIPFRPPYGSRLIVLPWILAQGNRPLILWDVEPDSYFRDAESMVSYVSEEVRPGSIILLHVEVGSRGEGRRALVGVLEELKARRYRFVTVSELLAGSEVGGGGGDPPRNLRPFRLRFGNAGYAIGQRRERPDSLVPLYLVLDSRARRRRWP